MRAGFSCGLRRCCHLFLLAYEFGAFAQRKQRCKITCLHSGPGFLINLL
jgi:hypothetical protein